jgi:LAO/AO transport system kinase
MASDPTLDAALRGDVRSIGRVLTSIEDRTDVGRERFSELYRRSGRAATVGVTGAPGAGKSTLVSALVSHLRSDHGTLAIVAVDPSSPFTGGAILGDRVRMGDHAGDDRVFIRSVANRGSLGGISETTPSIVAALDGLGHDEIVVETVGIGQSEVEIASTADTTVVVVPAGWGDAVQASKAGFLEVADVLVVNKADRADAARTVADLENMIALGPPTGWTPPVIATVATEGRGVEDLASVILSHRAHLADTDAGTTRSRMQAARQLAAAIRYEVDASASSVVHDDVVASIAARTIDPWTAAARIVREG